MFAKYWMKNKMLDSEMPLEEVESEIAIEFEDSNQAKVVYDSIMLEFHTAPDYRSSMELKLNDNIINIFILAEDSTSFRASFNSAIKWIKLSVEINNLIMQ